MLCIRYCNPDLYYISKIIRILYWTYLWTKFKLKLIVYSMYFNLFLILTSVNGKIRRYGIIIDHMSRDRMLNYTILYALFTMHLLIHSFSGGLWEKDLKMFLPFLLELNKFYNAMLYMLISTWVDIIFVNNLYLADALSKNIIICAVSKSPF